MITVIVNGEPNQIEEGASIEGLIQSLRLSVKGVIVEHNKIVVHLHDWPHTFLAQGDSVLILSIVGGG